MTLKRILAERRSLEQLKVNKRLEFYIFFHFVWIATNNKFLLTFSLYAGFAV